MLVTHASVVEQENDVNAVRLGLDLPAAAASAFEDIKEKFTNQRQWREFVSAVHCTVNYPAAINSLRSGTKWFSDGLAQASSCLKRTLLGARNRERSSQFR
ncbi:MAG: hypothetical protein ABI356_07975 [Steroidobacteraceae bacterium]